MKEIETDEEFKSAVKESKIVIVDFYTTWCVPCKFLAEKLDEVEKKYDSKNDIVRFFRADCDKVKKASRYIQSVPTVEFWVNGVKVKEIEIEDKKQKCSVVGNMDEERYTSRIEALLASLDG